MIVVVVFMGIVLEDCNYFVVVINLNFDIIFVLVDFIVEDVYKNILFVMKFDDCLFKYVV